MDLLEVQSKQIPCPKFGIQPPESSTPQLTDSFDFLSLALGFSPFPPLLLLPGSLPNSSTSI
uniref:Uncharacterized protein n=1 Tax=Cucumis melo TaxID=3656 RepID=A0A9I9EJL1_CUCME